MPSTFSRKTSRAIGTVSVQIGTYVVPAATQTIIVGLNVSNVLTNQANVTITHSDGTNVTTVVKNAALPAGSGLVAIGAEQKFCMQTGDSISVSSDIAASVDVFMSILEIS